MSRELKVNKRSGKRLLEKLGDVVEGLGGRADELTLENLEASGMFDKQQAEALRELFAEMDRRARAHMKANPRYLEEAVKSGKITEKEAAQVRKELGLLENKGASDE